jgi:undecaprenyl-diphosphatase
LIESIIEKDKQLLVLINQDWSNGLFDLLCPFMRTASNWYLIYAIIIYFLFNRYGKKAWYLLLTVAIAVLLSDQLSGNLIKHAVERLRPCNDPSLFGKIRVLVPCGSGFSFVSSHASNHFTAAIFIGTVFGAERKWIWPVVLLWAAFISYAQVYVGVHFPIDVICGSLLGITIGLIMNRLIRNYLITDKQQMV